MICANLFSFYLQIQSNLVLILIPIFPMYPINLLLGIKLMFSLNSSTNSEVQSQVYSRNGIRYILNIDIANEEAKKIESTEFIGLGTKHLRFNIEKNSWFIIHYSKKDVM